MRTVPCARLWEAEALEDRRLTGDLRTSFERHLETCADCQRERAFLAELRIRGLAIDVPKQTELEMRRQRAQVITAANRAYVAPVPRRPWFLGALCAAALVVAIVVFAHRPKAPGYAVTDLGHAHWSVVAAGQATRLSLTDGSARFEVSHLGAAQRFRVALPDGEIEVRGTAFVVHIDGGRTQHVAVETGVVMLTVDGVTRMLTAGDRWHRAEPAPSVSAAVPSVEPVMPMAAVAPPAPHKPVPKPRAHPSAAPSSSVEHGTQFVDAVAAYKSGDFVTADALFAEFLDKSPNDSRAEDAAFLRAMCASKRGDSTTAAARAKAYLARWPNGFRAAEAKKLVGD